MSFAELEKAQLFASTWQSDCVEVLEQKLPEPVQLAGAALHEHALAPAAPVHVWCAPHVTGAFAVTQPCASATQVVTSFVPEQNEPAAPPAQAEGAVLHWQLAAPAAPVHVSFEVHVVELGALSKRQLLASLAHVETLPPSQNGPDAVQTVALHAHRPVPPLHVWCVPQAVAPLLKTQLFASF